ncbi:MAG: succinate dehydrogenase, cytochrome b556 subunit [Burkholderiales bacterium]|nr:succinate dehydrogenase, cytochrome b556 subunit [Burkholderiales bacterium]
MTSRARPVFLNPLGISLPVGALTSIGHRVSGVVLSVSIPFWVYVWSLSVRDEQGFRRAHELMAFAALRVALVFFIWALAHHVLAGIRHLLSDVNVGSTLRSARKSAYAANLAGVAIALWAAWLLW